jgi:hypothetical protein
LNLVEGGSLCPHKLACIYLYENAKGFEKNNRDNSDFPNCLRFLFLAQLNLMHCSKWKITIQLKKMFQNSDPDAKTKNEAKISKIKNTQKSDNFLKQKSKYQTLTDRK